MTNAYVKGAKMHGAELVENCVVEKILVEQGKIVGVKTKSNEVIRNMF